MSYEREPIITTPTPAPKTTQHEMREERVVDPYAQPKNGRPSIIEAPVQTEPPAAAESVTLSPQMAALARKEQQARQKELAIKKREQELEARSARVAELEALEAKLAAKDYSGIEGKIDYDAFTKHLIEKSGSTTPEQEALKKLTEEVTNLKKSSEENASKQFEAAVNQRRIAVNELVESNPELSRIKKAKQQEAVVQHILDTWEFDDIELTPEQAAKDVNLYLKEEAKKWSQLLDEAAPVADQKTLPPLKPGIKTLTNNMTTSGDLKRPYKSLEGMSDSERYAEARRRAEEKLKLKEMA